MGARNVREGKPLGGRYLLSDEIAAGGMATVHVGRLLGGAGFSRTVAIKRLHAQFSREPDFVAMFLDEARIAARIRHPNVVSTIDVVVFEGEIFIVMEYVPGESLSRLMRACREQAGGGVPLPIAMSIIAGTLYGLHAAHEARDDRDVPLGVVHRDVSPQNVLLGEDGIPRVVDFGVAKAAGRLQSTAQGVLKGKLAYMPPEQIRGQAVDRRTDIYAASVMLWEMLAGRRLFVADNEATVLAEVLSGEVLPPSRHSPELGPAVDALVMKGLARDPAVRFATAWEMAESAQQIAHATAGQIGAWTHGLRGPALAQRAARVAEIESSLRHQEIVAVPQLADTRTTLVEEPRAQEPQGATREWLQHADAQGQSSHVGAFSTTPQAPRRARLPVGLAIAAPLVVLAAVGIIHGGWSGDPIATAPPAPPERAAPAASPASTLPTATAAPTAPPAPSTSASLPAAPTATPTSEPRSAPPHPAPRPPATPAGKQGCRPPYTVNADGVRVPKMECL